MVDRQPYTFDRVIRILFGVVSVVGLFYLVYILRGALLPFLVAWIVAYMLNPLVVYNKRVFKLKGRVVDYRGEFFRGLGLHHRFGGRNHQYRELVGRAVVYSFYTARL